MIRLSLAILLLFSCLPATLSAQAPPAAPQAEKPADMMTITVNVKEGTTDNPVADSVVFLRAARPKGPFEPTDPKPEMELSGFTDANGNAVFENVPNSITTRGLRLQAVTTYGGLTFKSPQNTAAPGLKVDLKVYEKGLDIDGIKFKSLRTIVEPWEGFLVFTQFYMLTNAGKSALDVSLLPGAEFEKGLPIVMPDLAKGIQVSGPGQSLVVNSTIFWNGTLNPGETVPLQVRYSMTAHDPDFVYEQTMDYPVDSLEIVVPLQTRFKKVPRLDKVTLAAPGFEVLSGKGILGLRNDLEFIGANGHSVKAGESFRFKLGGLPFHRNYTPFFIVALGMIFGIGIFVVGRRDMKRSGSKAAREELIESMRREKEALLNELVLLEGEWRDGEVSDREYEVESLAIRERLALLMKKIRDFETQAA